MKILEMKIPGEGHNHGTCIHLAQLTMKSMSRLKSNLAQLTKNLCLDLKVSAFRIFTYCSLFQMYIPIFVISFAKACRL